MLKRAHVRILLLQLGQGHSARHKLLIVDGPVPVEVGSLHQHLQILFTELGAIAQKCLAQLVDGDRAAAVLIDALEELGMWDCWVQPTGDCLHRQSQAP